MAFLGLREKLAVLAMLLLLATFGAITYASKSEKIPINTKTIFIRCIGALKKEQVLEVPYGIMVADLLTKLDLAEDADLSKLIFEERIKGPRLFIVPKVGEKSLYITGAVEREGIIYVPEDLQFNQLKGYLFLAADADTSCFRRRRRQLSEGETIHIPPRNSAESEFIVRK